MKAGVELLQNTLVDTLAVYRNEITRTNTTQLALPESMNALVLLILAIMKNGAFKTQDVRPDERVYFHHLIRSLPHSHLLSWFLPRMFCLSDLDEKSEKKEDSDEDRVELPPILNLSSQKLADRSSALLLDTSFELYLWVGSKVDPYFLNNVFGVEHASQINSSVNYLPLLFYFVVFCCISSHFSSNFLYTDKTRTL